MIWELSHRFDASIVPVADRHYNRRKVGSPQFVPPGRCVVLKTPTLEALWVTSWPFAEYVRHEWPGAWINSCFRREAGPLASEMIRAAVAVTRYVWPDTPALGMITFINREKVKHKRDPGRCYLRAGFEVCGETKGGLLALQLKPEAMPEPEAPLGSQMALDSFERRGL